MKRPPTDFHLWISGDLQRHWNACEALALRAAVGAGGEVFIAGDAVRCCRKSIPAAEFGGADQAWLAGWRKLRITPGELIRRARGLAPVHLTVCNLSLELAGLHRHELAPWVDDVAGAASFWQRLPVGAAPLVF